MSLSPSGRVTTLGFDSWFTCEPISVVITPGDDPAVPSWVSTVASSRSHCRLHDLLNPVVEDGSARNRSVVVAVALPRWGMRLHCTDLQRGPTPIGSGARKLSGALLL